MRDGHALHGSAGSLNEATIEGEREEMGEMGWWGLRSHRGDENALDLFPSCAMVSLDSIELCTKWSSVVGLDASYGGIKKAWASRHQCHRGT